MWLLVWTVVSMTPAKAGNPQNGFPQKWTAKTVVTEKEVQQAGLDRCFASEPISDETFQRMQGKSWKKNAGGEVFVVTIFVSSKADGTYQIQQFKIDRQTAVY